MIAPNIDLFTLNDITMQVLFQEQYHHILSNSYILSLIFFNIIVGYLLYFIKILYELKIINLYIIA
ncbi:hypothetical protein RAT170B_0800 [Rickettsia argasii T170-B]|uniref:Uncharacterized protein n=1 Tax=Rickettsia argasii T170-B TaxID=1268837 RepID=A0A0F3RIS4_9RICK|nr:hypothetical protein RAT170B_0800 [Rickettsia argasii T170-B]